MRSTFRDCRCGHTHTANPRRTHRRAVDPPAAMAQRQVTAVRIVWNGVVLSGEEPNINPLQRDVTANSGAPSPCKALAEFGESVE